MIPCSCFLLPRLLFTTCYMSSTNSSTATCHRAQRLANQIGSNHMNISIDDMVEATTGTFALSCSRSLKFKVQGGSSAENLALQNVQARCRMVLSYLYGQLTPWSQGKCISHPGLYAQLHRVRMGHPLKLFHRHIKYNNVPPWYVFVLLSLLTSQ